MSRREGEIGLVATVAALCLIVAASPLLAREKRDRAKERKPRLAVVYGVVGVTKNEKGDELTGVTITRSATRVYHVVLDEKGQELGKTMEGKRVAAKGTTSKKDDQRWITVQAFKEAAAKRPKEGRPPKEKPKPPKDDEL